jgi:hypothetical protein
MPVYYYYLLDGLLACLSMVLFVVWYSLYRQEISRGVLPVSVAMESITWGECLERQSGN